MTGSNISKMMTDYQSKGFSKGNADAVKKQEDAQAVFATMLGQMNLNVNQQEFHAETEKTGLKSITAVETTDEVSENSQIKEYAKGKDTSRIKKAEDTGAAVKEKAEELAGETSERICEALEEELSITSEELNAVLEELGLEPLDLLNPANLVQIMSEFIGAEGTDSLLMSVEFVNVMKAMNEIAAELSVDLGISPEELMQMLPEITEQTEQIVLPEEQTMQQSDTIAGDVLAQQPQKVVEVADDAVPTQKPTEITDEAVSVKPETVQETQQEVVEQQNADGGSESAQEEQSGMKEQNTSVKSEDKNTEHTVFETNVSQTVHQGQTAEVHTMPTVTTYTGDVNVTEIMQQITEYVKVSVMQDTSSIEMQLNPENLGKVYLHLSATKEGNITAQFAAQSEAVKEALETQLVELRQTLNQQGVKVDAIEVTVATHEFERNLEQNAHGEEQQEQQKEKQQGRRNLNLGQLDELSGLMSEEEMLAAKIMRENGNRMDVTA